MVQIKGSKQFISKSTTEYNITSSGKFTYFTKRAVKIITE